VAAVGDAKGVLAVMVVVLATAIVEQRWGFEQRWGSEVVIEQRCGLEVLVEIVVLVEAEVVVLVEAEVVVGKH
jgi:hypothetical protein